MQFPNGSGKRLNMMYPVDNTYWTKLKAFVDYEPVSAIDPELRGVLASIGIVKGQPFSPTAKQRELLQKAVETAPKMILALRQLGRPDGRQLYYKDRRREEDLFRVATTTRKCTRRYPALARLSRARMAERDQNPASQDWRGSLAPT